MSSGPSQAFQHGSANPSSMIGCLTDCINPLTTTCKESHVAGQSGSITQTMSNKKLAFIYCAILALQFGLQPMIANTFTNKGIPKTSIVIATELAKIEIAIHALAFQPPSPNPMDNWTLKDSLRIAAFPAVLYAIQNLLVQYAYVYLDSMTFNLLN